MTGIQLIKMLSYLRFFRKSCIPIKDRRALCKKRHCRVNTVLAKPYIFVRIAEKDASGTLLSGLHHLKDAVQADSDQRIDSEQPPVQIRPLM